MNGLIPRTECCLTSFLGCMSRHILDMPNAVTVSWVTAKLACWTILIKKKRQEFWVSNFRTLYAFGSSQLSLFMHTNKNIWWEKIGLNNNGQDCCFMLYIKEDAEKKDYSELQHVQDETIFTHKLSTVSLLVIQCMSCNAQSERSMSPYEATCSSAVSLGMTIYSTLLGVLIQWTARISNDQSSWNTHMMNTVTCSNSLVPVIVNLVLLHENMHYTVLVNITQLLMCFDDWSRVSVRQEM